MNWNYDGNPTDPGWYAVLICYDTEEGMIPSAAEWDGAQWMQPAVVAFGDRCETSEKAARLAYDNDPDIG